jgi:hypothetical protein
VWVAVTLTCGSSSHRAGAPLPAYIQLNALPLLKSSRKARTEFSDLKLSPQIFAEKADKMLHTKAGWD